MVVLGCWLGDSSAPLRSFAFGTPEGVEVCLLVKPLSFGGIRARIQDFKRRWEIRV